jgi:hypothetical protein
MRIASVAVALAFAMGLAACTQPAPPHDKAYYLTHPNERTAAISACRGDPGGLGKTSNCVNATAADGQVESDRFWAVKKPKSRVANPNSL